MSEKINVSIVLPTYNEAQNISMLIQRISAAIPNSKEIIVVDDNSPDRTWEIAGKHENVRVIRRTNERGLVTAIWRGISEAKGENVVWLDADLSMPPEIIPDMLGKLQENDIVVGSRYVKGGRDKRPLIRVISSRVINLIANIILNFKVLDYDSGFIAAKKNVLMSMKLGNAAYGDYCIELLYKAGKKGYRINEIPYSFTDRRAGESKTADTVISLVKYGWLYLKKIMELRLEKE